MLKRLLLGLSVGFVIFGMLAFCVTMVGTFFGWSWWLPPLSALVVIVAAAFVGAIDVDGS